MAEESRYLTRVPAGTGKRDRLPLLMRWPPLGSACCSHRRKPPGWRQPPGQPLLKAVAAAALALHPARWPMPRLEWPRWWCGWPASLGVDRLQAPVADRARHRDSGGGRETLDGRSARRPKRKQCERLWLPEAGRGLWQALGVGGAAPLAGLALIAPPRVRQEGCPAFCELLGPMGRLPQRAAGGFQA